MTSRSSILLVLDETEGKDTSRIEDVSSDLPSELGVLVAQQEPRHRSHDDDVDDGGGDPETDNESLQPFSVRSHTVVRETRAHLTTWREKGGKG